MNTCRCCGQVVLPGDAPRAAINVDEALLLLCNEAHRFAEEQASASVEIAHLVCCLTSARVPDHDFQRAGIDRRRLSEAARAWLHGAGRAPDGRKPRTSDEFKVALSRAEAVAVQEARRFAGPYDFIRALVQRSGDLASARFVVEAIERRAGAGEISERAAEEPRGHDRVETRRAAMGERGPRPAQLQFRFERRYRPHVGTQARQESQDGAGARAGHGAAELRDRDGQERGASGEVRDSRLAERLQRQEALVADLVGLISRVIDTRGDAGNARADMAPGHQRDGDDGVSSEVCSNGASGNSNSNSGGSRSLRSGRGRSRLRFKRRRTLILGGSSLSSTSWGEGGGSRKQEGLLRVVSRNEPAAADRRLGAVRAQAQDPDEGMGSAAEIDTDDDGYALGDSLGDRMKRFYLSPDDDIVRAPSIGPKTAARLTPVGLVLVRDLLACDPEDIVARTGNRYITVGRIADWKAQARLVCTIPWLRGTHAQLLVGAGYDTLSKLSRADASSVCSAILRFSATREGQSILRSGPPPEIDRIACWIENTALAEPARAA